VQAPGQLLFRKLWQRTAERRLEASDHHRVLFGQESPDERRRIGVGTTEQAQEILSAALSIARELERRDEHRRQDALARQHVRRRLALEARQKCDALAVHRIEASRQHGFEQLFLAAEVIADGGEVDLGQRRDLAQRRRLEAVFHEQSLGSVEDPVLGRRRPAGLRRADRARFGLRLLHWISGRPPGGNPLAANSVKRLFECYRPAGDAVNGGSRPGA
jgi:hypothetical protein